MSGILGEAFTPCPSRSRSSGISNRSGSDKFDSFTSTDDSIFETTAEIEFTTEIRVPTLTGARPRRNNRAASGFQIHEDTKERRPAPVEKRRKANGGTDQTLGRKSSLLAQPAQRFRPKTSLASSNSPKPTLKRDVQQDSVYLPPDDAAVPSIYMGLFSPLKQEKPQPKVTEQAPSTTSEARAAMRQARKSSTLNVRRAPLQASTKIAQEAAFRVDVVGKNGGKENIPPGGLYDIEKKIDVKPTKSFNRPVKSDSPLRQAPRAATRQVKDTKSVERGLAGGRLPSQSSPAPVARKKALVTESKGPVVSASLNARASALSDRLAHSRLHNSSRSRPATSTSRAKGLDSQYPKLSENIKKPALYEDDWLSHQETVITQLINSLFEYSNGNSNFYDQSSLRLELLELYHTDAFVQLHKKLKASLSCGTLAIPRHILSHSSRLKQDIGLRRKFLDIWVQSYNLHALAAAAETVIGRRISSDDELFQSNRKIIVRKLEGFLETFLLRNEDLDRPTPGQPPKTYQRTVLRCIMLVALIDQARQSSESSLPRQLFTSSSPHKSSVDVLQALVRLLLPSAGDISKQLSHLGCDLSYKQHKLQEYDYQIENIAVDLRDGVRLTRIVEVLFFTRSHSRCDGDQTEVTLNTGEALSLLGDHADVPLSAHLRYPCVSRAAKLHNVQIALSALESVKGSKPVIGNVRAEDIVDGYRERTIALLWALVSNWSLAGLVDWEDVSKEISRLQRKCVAQFGYEVRNKHWFTGEEIEDDGEDDHAYLLQHWAGLLAGLRRLHMDNLTSSFANGAIYESIVDEYEPYITGETRSTSKPSVPRSLETRLGALGCSSQFAHLVSPKPASSHTPGRDFTLGALAFLCSRLLSTSKRARAATTLQRAWRVRLEDQIAFRRTMAKKLATHCAAVVQTRNEILWAKQVIIRWWRQVQTRRFQNATRAQALRKPVRNPAARRL